MRWFLEGPLLELWIGLLGFEIKKHLMRDKAMKKVWLALTNRNTSVQIRKLSSKVDLIIYISNNLGSQDGANFYLVSLVRMSEIVKPFKPFEMAICLKRHSVQLDVRQVQMINVCLISLRMYKVEKIIWSNCKRNKKWTVYTMRISLFQTVYFMSVITYSKYHVQTRIIATWFIRLCILRTD